MLQLSFCSKSINGDKQSQQHTISGISTYALNPACNSVGTQGELPHSRSTIFVVF